MTPTDPFIGKVLAERFEILERLGDGGTGVVYKARQLSVDRIIALKVLGAHVSTDPQWIRRFQNEARAASRLEHPNTVRVIDFGQTREGLLFIAMEYLHGHSLRTEIDQMRRLPHSRVLHIVSQVCASLSEAHAQGIIHRDIKPDNIYLVEKKGAGDVVKVLDFSVAKFDSPDGQLTRAGVVFGTPAYMSPEQGRGVTLDPRSDIYAVGVVAYEMLSGRPPFEHQIPTEVVLMHLRQQPAPLVDVPTPVAQLVMRTLEKEPARRPANAEQLAEECQRIMAELSPQQKRRIGAASAVSPSQLPAAPPPAAVPIATASATDRTMMALPDLPRLGAPPPLEAPLSPPAPPPRLEVSPALGRMSTPRSTERRTVAIFSVDSMSKVAPPQRSSRGTATAPISLRMASPTRIMQPQRRGQKPFRVGALAGSLFWTAWVLFGIGIGVAMHFLLSRGGR
jgi:serine/threonine protein kinase